MAATFRELRVWQNAMDLAMEVFEISKRFPLEERFSMTDQIRRASRSIATNTAEAWRKRRYKAAFVSKLSDCDGETNETDTALDFALACSYIPADRHQELTALCCEIGRMLGAMIRNPEPFLLA